MKFEYLSVTDPEMHTLLADELGQQRATLDLVPSENYPSPSVLDALGSPIALSQAEGCIGTRNCSGTAILDKVEQLACERLQALFDTPYVNVQPHSEEQALFTACNILLTDTSQNAFICLSSYFEDVASDETAQMPPYVFDAGAFTIDYDAFERYVLLRRPQLIAVSASTYFRAIDFERVADIAHKVDAALLADLSTISGLVAAGVYPSPLPYADIVIGATHATMRGPRGAFTLFKDSDLQATFDQVLSPAVQGSVLMNAVAAKAVAFAEADTPGFQTAGSKSIEAANVIAQGAAEGGCTVFADGKTDTHLCAIGLDDVDLAPQAVLDLLESVGISASVSNLPVGGDLKPVPHLLLSAAPLVTRGLDTYEARFVGELLARLLSAPTDEETVGDVRTKIEGMLKDHPLYPGLEE
ncbi:MAG: hypothetical protein LUD25_04705 [Coriobacteriaceae bacterium]|nr:hypothetical protein [Coriobacteriaceae bacterium]